MSKTGELFGTFFKIGAFTFGGGYAMVALLEHEFVEKKRWLTREEFLDMVAIAESTPGPVAVNSATYIGYIPPLGWFGRCGAFHSGGVPAVLCSHLPYFALLRPLFAADGGGQCFQGHSGLCHLPDPVRRGQDAQKLAAHPLQHGSGGGGVGGDGGAARGLRNSMVGCSVLAVKFSSICCILLCGAAGVLAYAIGQGKKGGTK